jgi:hypothetical protein
MQIIVRRDYLPEKEPERDEFLKKYFCELAVSAKQVRNGWSLSLNRPTRADFYIDPNLVKGLEWWSNNFGQVDVPGIPFAVWRRAGMQLSLNDSWTIYSWSQWLSKSVAPASKPQVITLLHVDDHDDLMTPRVLVGGHAGYDAISGFALDLCKPETVESAVRSGAIGIGSFMAPLLHFLPGVHVRHLCSTEYAKERLGPHIVRPIRIPDELLAPGSLRPAVELKRIEDVCEGDRKGCHPYIVTDDLKGWLKDLPEGPVLVHIDMDYFNNRFNGDSDWVDDGPKYDPPLSGVVSRIDQVFDSLKGEQIAGRVADFAVALSPGFFPADMWAPSIERIQNHIDELIDANQWMTEE